MGIQRLRLIDFDQVSLSSLNRNALACLRDVGTSKVQAIKSHIKSIVPWVEVEAEDSMFREESASHLLRGRPAFVLDCIDDISSKAALIAACIQGALRVITSMGAGGKADPTRIRIGTFCTII